MVHLLLVAAAIAFYFGITTQSAVGMASLLLLSLLLIAAWVYARFKLLFPNLDEDVQITPLTPQELEQLRIRREQLQAAAIAAQPPPTEMPRIAPSPLATPTATPPPTLPPAPVPVPPAVHTAVPASPLPPLPAAAPLPPMAEPRSSHGVIERPRSEPVVTRLPPRPPTVAPGDRGE